MISIREKESSILRTQPGSFLSSEQYGFPATLAILMVDGLQADIHSLPFAQ